MQMAHFLPSLSLSLSLSHSRSIRPFRALSPILPFCLCLFLPTSLPSYIKQTVSLAALGDIVLIFQHCRTGVMQCAAVDILHEDLSLLKWAKSWRTSLSHASIYPRRTFINSGVCCWTAPQDQVATLTGFKSLFLIRGKMWIKSLTNCLKLTGHNMLLLCFDFTSVCTHLRWFLTLPC